jgi:hypothetical protein
MVMKEVLFCVSGAPSLSSSAVVDLCDPTLNVSYCSERFLFFLVLRHLFSLMASDVVIQR